MLITSIFFYFSHIFWGWIVKTWDSVVMDLFFTRQQNFWLVHIKAFAYNILIVNRKLKFALGMVENTVGKGENAGYQNFLFFL